MILRTCRFGQACLRECPSMMTRGDPRIPADRDLYTAELAVEKLLAGKKEDQRL